VAFDRAGHAQQQPLLQLERLVEVAAAEALQHQPDARRIKAANMDPLRLIGCDAGGLG
jgi:hypothetical protein